jgi:hypothetical protein
MIHNVLFIFEVDEYEHSSYSVQYEIHRIRRFKTIYDWVYVLRYNPDQPDGLSDIAFDKLARKCWDIIDVDYETVYNTDGGIYIEYVGYSNERVSELTTEFNNTMSSISSEVHEDVAMP